MPHWRDLLSFPPLLERLDGIDRELEQIGNVPDVDLDALGFLDEAETLAGDGFIALQLYMIERKGNVDSREAYACGPMHNNHYIAELLHTAGNYRKHRAEWPEPSDWKTPQNRTVAMFRDAGAAEGDYWLLNMLSCLNGGGAPRFESLVPRLIEWREAFDARFSS